MATMSPPAGDQHYAMAVALVPAGRRRAGRSLILFATLAFAAVLLIQILFDSGAVAVGFADWRPVLYAYLLWGVALGAAQVIIKGERGHQALFLLPAVFFTVAMVIFPTFFGSTSRSPTGTSAPSPAAASAASTMSAR